MVARVARRGRGRDEVAHPFTPLALSLAYPPLDKRRSSADSNFKLVQRSSFVLRFCSCAGEALTIIHQRRNHLRLRPLRLRVILLREPVPPALVRDGDLGQVVVEHGVVEVDDEALDDVGDLGEGGLLGHLVLDGGEGGFCDTGLGWWVGRWTGGWVRGRGGMGNVERGLVLGDGEDREEDGPSS